MNQLQTMLYTIKNQLPNAAILVTTPPPSVLHQKKKIDILKLIVS